MKKNYLAISQTNIKAKWMVIATIIYLIIYYLMGLVETRYPYLWFQLIYICAITSLAIIAKKIYITNKVLFHPLKGRKVWILNCIFCMMLIMLYLILGTFKNWTIVFSLKPELMLASVCVALAAGVGEEIMCRALLFNLFAKIFENRKYTLLWTSLSSALFFGIFHLINLMHGSSAEATMQQIFYATAIGLAFSYVHIFTNRIWPCILLHFLLDLQPNIESMNTQASPWGSVLVVFGTVILISLISIYLINRKILMYFTAK